MSESLISLKKRKQNAADLAMMVRAMKAISAANISQYEMALHSLEDYFYAISIGIHDCLSGEKQITDSGYKPGVQKPLIVNLFIGSDQGLVGNFNRALSKFGLNKIKDKTAKKIIWAVGERVAAELHDENTIPTEIFNVPDSINAVTPLVNKILIKSEKLREEYTNFNFNIFHNSRTSSGGIRQIFVPLLPLDRHWISKFSELQLPAKRSPQIIGGVENTFRVLIREYLFVSIYRACAESLASENISRLEAMHRAEKNINEISEDLNKKYNQLRQSSIDEELFDIVSGFEALK